MRKKTGFPSEKLFVLHERLIEELSQHPLIKPLFITDIGFFPKAKYHYRERAEGSSSYILLFCIAGEGWVKLGSSGKQHVQKHDLIVIPPNMPQSYGAAEANPWSIYWIHFTGILAEHYFELLPLQENKMQLSGASAIQWIKLFDSCYDTISEKIYSLPHCIYANQLLQQMLSLPSLQPADPSNQASSNCVDRSIEYMKQQLSANLTVGQLAEFVHLSRSHYLSVFKRVTGISPMHYFMRLKIQQACQYLDFTDCSIKEISLKVGFQDPLYFSRAFHKIIGQSPSDYRKIMKG